MTRAGTAGRLRSGTRHTKIGYAVVPGGGGGAAACSFVAAVFPGNTSDDAYGQTQGWDGVFHQSSPATLLTGSISGGASLYGTPQDGSTWGISAGVFDGPQHFTAHWAFPALAAATAMCRWQIIHTGAAIGAFSIESSPDGVSWTTIVPSLAAGGDGMASGARRYWRLTYDETVGVPGLWYYPGEDLKGLLLWAAA